MVCVQRALTEEPWPSESGQLTARTRSGVGWAYRRLVPERCCRDPLGTVGTSGLDRPISVKTNMEFPTTAHQLARTHAAHQFSVSIACFEQHRNTRAVRVAARRTAIASVFNRQQRSSPGRTAAARSLEHLPRRLGLHSEHYRTVRTARHPTRQSVISSAPYDNRMGQTSEGHRISRARATPSGYRPVIGNRDKRPAST